MTTLREDQERLKAAFAELGLAIRNACETDIAAANRALLRLIRSLRR